MALKHAVPSVHTNVLSHPHSLVFGYITRNEVDVQSGNLSLDILGTSIFHTRAQSASSSGFPTSLRILAVFLDSALAVIKESNSLKSRALCLVSL